MKTSEIREKSESELRDLETSLRDQLLKLKVARATQRSRNTAQFGQVRKDIARVQTIAGERRRGQTSDEGNTP